MDLLVAIGRGETVAMSSSSLDSLVELAIDHRVPALLRRAAIDGRIGGCGISSLELSLAAHELRAIVRLERLEAAAVPVVGRLVDRGCNVMVAKGWWASHLLHERPSDRTFSDIDLIIPPGWAMRKAEIDDALGPSRAHDLSVRAPADSLAWWTYDLPGITVDVHRNPFTLEQAAVPEASWVWREHVVTNDHRWGAALAPTLELGLAQLAVNYGKDRLRWLYQLDDIRRLIVHPDLNWPRFWELVYRGGVGRPVTAVLTAVGRTLDVDLPPGIGRPSPLMFPWAGEHHILGKREPIARTFSIAAYRALAGGGLSPALRAASMLVLPGREALASSVEAKSLVVGSGYVRGLGALYWHYVKRLAGTVPAPTNDTPAAPVWWLTKPSAGPRIPFAKSDGRT